MKITVLAQEKGRRVEGELKRARRLVLLCANEASG
jgi:hypothetical protein